MTNSSTSNYATPLTDTPAAVATDVSPDVVRNVQSSSQSQDPVKSKPVRASVILKPGRRTKKDQKDDNDGKEPDEALKDLVSGLSGLMAPIQKVPEVPDSPDEEFSSSGASSATDSDDEAMRIIKPKMPEKTSQGSSGQGSQSDERAKQIAAGRQRQPTTNIERTTHFFEIHAKKLYYRGYLYKKNEFGVDGKLLTKSDIIGNRGLLDTGGEWTKWWAELLGAVLMLWRVPDEIASMAYEPEPDLETLLQLELQPTASTLDMIKSSHDSPVCINITDASSELLAHDFKPDHEASPPPPVPYTSFFALSTAGANLFLFATPSYISSNSWVASIRLSKFEIVNLNSVFSLNMLRNAPYVTTWYDLGIQPFQSAYHKQEVKFTGTVNARHAFQVSWKEYFCVVMQERTFEQTLEKISAPGEPAPKRLSKFFGGKKKDPVTDPFSEEPSTKTETKVKMEIIKGHIHFYESKADMKRGAKPVMSVEDVNVAYAVWPEKAGLVKMDLVGLVKVQGKVILASDMKKSHDKDRARMSKISERPQSLIFPIGSLDFTKPPSSAAGATNLPSKPSPPHVLITSANTHESLHWFVAILGAFRLDADIDICDVHSALWLDPPPNWGALCLSVDEIAGFSASASAQQSFIEYTRLLRDKKATLKAGLFADWVASVKTGIEQRQKYERREVEVKARELIAWVEKLKVGPIKLPSWVENELFTKFGSDFGDLAYAGSAPEDQEQTQDDPTESIKNGNQVSPTNTRFSGSQVSPTRSHGSGSQFSQTKSFAAASQVSPTRSHASMSVKSEQDATSPTVPTGDLVSLNSEERKTTSEQGSIRHTRLDTKSIISSHPSEKPSSPASAHSSEMDRVPELKTSEETPEPPRTAGLARRISMQRVAAKNFLMDLTSTAPVDFSLDSSEGAKNWYQEEQDRIKTRETWLAGMDLAPLSLREATLSGEKRNAFKKQGAGESTDENDNGANRDTVLFDPDSQEIDFDGDPDRPKGGFQLFASNSLLEKANAPVAVKDTDGPLLGAVDKEGNKPRLEAGLLGQMDRREKEWENIKKRGGYRATMMPGMADYTIPPQGFAPYPMYPQVPGQYPMPYPMYPGPMAPPMPNASGYPPGQGMPYPQYYPPAPMSEAGFEDPMTTQMKEQWLESERLKERTKAQERMSMMPPPDRNSMMPPAQARLSVMPSPNRMSMAGMPVSSPAGKNSIASSESARTPGQVGTPVVDVLSSSESSESSDGQSDGSGSSLSEASEESEEEGLVSGKKGKPQESLFKKLETDESSSTDDDDSEEEDDQPIHGQDHGPNMMQYGYPQQGPFANMPYYPYYPGGYPPPQGMAPNGPYPMMSPGRGSFMPLPGQGYPPNMMPPGYNPQGYPGYPMMQRPPGPTLQTPEHFPGPNVKGPVKNAVISGTESDASASSGDAKARAKTKRTIAPGKRRSAGRKK